MWVCDSILRDGGVLKDELREKVETVAGMMTDTLRAQTWVRLMDDAATLAFLRARVAQLPDAHASEFAEDKVTDLAQMRAALFRVADVIAADGDGSSKLLADIVRLHASTARFYETTGGYVTSGVVVTMLGFSRREHMSPGMAGTLRLPQMQLGDGVTDAVSAKLRRELREVLTNKAQVKHQKGTLKYGGGEVVGCPALDVFLGMSDAATVLSKLST